MRRAFTILELLATVALSAVLMVAVLHVLGTIGRDRAASAAPAEAQVWRADLLDLLRRDLAGSTGARFGESALTLTGHAGLARDTAAARDEPVVVRYVLVSLHGRNWLVRRQTARAGRAGAAAWTELVCPDVVRFSVRPGATLSERAETGVVARDSDQPIPASVVLRLELAGERPVEEVLVLR